MKIPDTRNTHIGSPRIAIKILTKIQASASDIARGASVSILAVERLDLIGLSAKITGECIEKAPASEYSTKTGAYL